MSGGSLNYFFSDLEYHVGDFKDKELDDLVKDLAELFHAREWYLSSDTNEGTWKEARDAFKEKWFGKDSRSERIEKYLDEIKAEIMDQFGLSDKYCINCKNWTPEEKDDSGYGWCSNTKGCMMHRRESCDKFANRE